MNELALFDNYFHHIPAAQQSRYHDVRDAVAARHFITPGSDSRDEYRPTATLEVRENPHEIVDLESGYIHHATAAKMSNVFRGFPPSAQVRFVKQLHMQLRRFFLQKIADPHLFAPATQCEILTAYHTIEAHAKGVRVPFAAQLLPLQNRLQADSEDPQATRRAFLRNVRASQGGRDILCAVGRSAVRRIAHADAAAAQLAKIRSDASAS